MKRIAFFGGSFDPPHHGHLAIAKAAADRFALDKVLFAPVARQPLKDDRTATSFFHRYAMTVLATQADARFVPSLLDSPRLDAPTSRPNYTVETLDRLRSSFAEETCLFTLLGADSWLEIARWYDAGRLLTLTDWIVAARPGFSIENAERALPPGVASEQVRDSSEHFLNLHHANGTTTRVSFLPSMQEDISATELRSSFDPDLLDVGRADAEFLPTAVREYICKTGLYRRVPKVSPLRPG